MCGRFAMALEPERIQPTLESYGFKVAKIENLSKVRPSLNKSPQSYSMIFCKDEQNKTNDLVAMRWTLQPSWAHEMVKYPSFNTRSESLSPLKPAWRSATHRRGILAMQGYYEWDKHEHLPYYIHNSRGKSAGRSSEADGEIRKEDQESLMYCLVIWDTNPKLCDVPTFSIVTTKASGRLAEIHERMPVIVKTREEAEQWTEGKWPSVLNLIRANEELDLYRVAKDVNKVGTEKPDLNVPIRVKRQQTMSDFFRNKKRPLEVQRNESDNNAGKLRKSD